MRATFREARYQAEKLSYLEHLTDTVESLQKLSQDRRRTLRAAEGQAAPAPLAQAPSLPRSPISQPGRVAAIAGGNKTGSGHLANDEDLAAAVAAWIETESKRRGSKVSWKEGLLHMTSGRGSMVTAAEVSPSKTQAGDTGFDYTREAGWLSRSGPRSTSDATAIQIARTAALSAPVQPLHAAEADTGPVAEIARALMRAKHIDYKTALLEASTL